MQNSYFCTHKLPLKQMSIPSEAFNIEIQHPELWTLAMRIEPRRALVAAHCPAERDSLIYRTVEFDKAQEDPLHALQSAVYDNPFFLYEFGSVKIVLYSMRFIIVPQAIADDYDLSKRSWSILYGEPTGDISVDSLAGCNAAIVFETTHGLLPFLNRTFYNPPIRHHLSTLCEYFANLNVNFSRSRLYAYLHDKRADIILFRAGKLAFANTFQCLNADDAAFYILALCNQHHIDPVNDEIQLSGDKTTRNAVAERLRNYVTYVMPAMYPISATKIGRNSVVVPLDLILSSI